MDRNDFKTFGAYLTALWPSFDLTPEQSEVWYDKIRWTDIYTARKAAGEAYARNLWKEPKLGEVLNAIKAFRRADPKGDGNFTPETVSLIEQEEQEEAMALAGWTDSDFSAGKDAIETHEPGMKAFFGGLPARGRWWTHFLSERFGHNRVILYPGGRPLQMSRDAFWDSCHLNRVTK